MEEFIREMDALRSKMVSAVGDLRALPFVQDEISATAENISKEVSRRTQTITGAVSTYKDNVSKECDSAAKKTLALKDDVSNKSFANVYIL